MKTKIKDLNHALELYEQGVLVPMKSILVDVNYNERMFLGFNLLKDMMFTLNIVGDGVLSWSNYEVTNNHYHIKPKTKIVKFESFLYLWKSGNLSISREDFQSSEILKKEKIVREFEVECEE